MKKILVFCFLINNIQAQSIVIINNYFDKNSKNNNLLPFGYRLNGDHLSYIKYRDSLSLSLGKDNNYLTGNFVLEDRQNLVYLFSGDTIIATKLNDHFQFVGKRSNEWNSIYPLDKIGYPLIGLYPWNISLMEEKIISQGKFIKSQLNKLIDTYSDSLRYSNEYKNIILQHFYWAFLTNYFKAIETVKFKNVNNKKIIYSYLYEFEILFRKEMDRDNWLFEGALTQWAKTLAKLKYPPERDIHSSKTYNSIYNFDIFENFKNRIDYAYKFLLNPVRDEVIFKLFMLKYRTNTWENYIEAEAYTNKFLAKLETERFRLALLEMQGKYKVKSYLDSPKSVNETILMNPDGSFTSWQEVINQNNSTFKIIDFWATWCGPCIKEIKESYDNVKQINKNGGEVISISIDDNIEHWKAGLEKLAIENDRQNYLVSRSSEFAKFFKANESVPRHVLLNKNGKIITKNSPSLNSPGVLNIKNENL